MHFLFIVSDWSDGKKPHQDSSARLCQFFSANWSVFTQIAFPKFIHKSQHTLICNQASIHLSLSCSAFMIKSHNYWLLIDCEWTVGEALEAFWTHLDFVKPLNSGSLKDTRVVHLCDQTSPENQPITWYQSLKFTVNERTHPPWYYNRINWVSSDIVQQKKSIIPDF